MLLLILPRLFLLLFPPVDCTSTHAAFTSQWAHVLVLFSDFNDTMAELGLEFETSDSSLVLYSVFSTSVYQHVFQNLKREKPLFSNLLFNSPLNLSFCPKILRIKCLSRKERKLRENREFLPILFTHVPTSGSQQVFCNHLLMNDFVSFCSFKVESFYNVPQPL